jgi:hypothetical protein
MIFSEILELYDHHERRLAAYPRYRREETGKVVRMISLGADDGMISYSRLCSEDADGVIEGELEFFSGLGQRFEWKLYSHDGPADLGERLAAHGFSVGEDEAVMALDLEAIPDALASKPEFDIRRVSDAGTLRDYAAVNAAVWPDDDGNDALIAGMEATLRDEGERMSAYVAYADGSPVCAARVDFPALSPFASLWGGSTLGPYRKRGFYTALLSVRAREAIERGYRFLTIDALPMSRPIAARHGFRLLAMSNPCDSPRALAR